VTTAAVQTRAFDALLDEVRQVHHSIPDLQDFVAFPSDLIDQHLTPYGIPAADLLARDRGLATDRFARLRDAVIAAGLEATWRETYKNTDIGQDFLDRFGCYCLIGDRGPFIGDTIRAYFVYMPAGLHYPWHHHPAEEMYFVIAGEAEFLAEGRAPRVLQSGDTVMHGKNQSHATETHDLPLLAYVVWRNEFETLPVLTPPERVP